MAQAGDKVGTLLVEVAGWTPAWFSIRNGYLFQYQDKNALKPQTGTLLTGRNVDPDPTSPKPFTFTLTTHTSNIRYAAESEEEMNEWVKVLREHSGGAKGANSSASPLVNRTEANSAAATAAAAKFAAATIFPEAFWSDSFGKSEEVTWGEFARVYQDQAKCDFVASGSGPAMYCIANIISQGLLTIKGVLTRANFMMLMTLLGPFTECHTKCKEIVKAGYFHGELSSEGCKMLMGPNPEPGTFLLRLRRGTRNQFALAVAENGTITHTLIDCDKGHFNFRQTNTSYPSIIKLVESLPNMCKKPVMSDIMVKFGIGQCTLPLIDQGGSYPPPMFDTSKATSSQKALLDEIVEAKKELHVVQNRFVFGVESPLLELTAVKDDKEPESQMLRKHIKTCTDNAIMMVEIPALQAKRKMKVQMSSTGKDTLQRFLHKVPLENMDKVGLYLPKTGVWIDLGRQLSNYLIEPDSTIQVKHRPDEIKTLLVRNRATGTDEHIIVDDNTTILGLIQACGKLVLSRVPYSGIRLFANTPFFALISAKLSDYKIGTEITEVEYDDAGQDALYVSPESIPGLRVKLEDYVDMSRTIHTLSDKVCCAVCKLTGALPPINPTTAPVLMKKAAAMGMGQLARPQTRMVKPGTSEERPPVASGSSRGVVVIPSIPPSMPAPAPGSPTVPSNKIINGTPTDADYKKLSEELPAMELELQDTMKWIAELVYLAVWWDNLDSSKQKAAETIQEAQTQVKHLFGPLCTNKASRGTLIQNGALTPKQIMAVIKCLDAVAQSSTAH